MWRPGRGEYLSLAFRALLVCLVLVPGSAFLPRHALVIGNSDYDKHGGLTSLPNAATDAVAVASQLRDLSWNVMLHQNVNVDELYAAIDTALHTLTTTRGHFLFYYAGHGVSREGKAYLVPVGMPVNRLLAPSDLNVFAFQLSRLQDALSSLHTTNIFVLDMCRSAVTALSPRTRSALLLEPTLRMPALHDSAGSYIAFSTSDGSEAYDAAMTESESHHSPFTGSFLRHVRAPGLSIFDLFSKVTNDVHVVTGGAQIVETSSKLRQTVYLHAVERVACPSHLFRSIADHERLCTNAFLALACSESVYHSNPAQFLSEDTRTYVSALSHTPSPASRHSKGNTATAEASYKLFDSAGIKFVAFRGTDISDSRDIWSDIDLLQTPAFQGYVHRGFWARASAVDIKPLKALVESGHRMVLTGHSLGGAVAALGTLRLLGELSAEYHVHVSCITFGQPLVGDARLADFVDSRGYRHVFHAFINGADIVPRLLLLHKEWLGTVLDGLASISFVQTAMETVAEAVGSRWVTRLGAAVARRALGWWADESQRPFKPFGQSWFLKADGDREYPIVFLPGTREFELRLTGEGNAIDTDSIQQHTITNYASFFEAQRTGRVVPVQPVRLSSQQLHVPTTTVVKATNAIAMAAPPASGLFDETINYPTAEAITSLAAIDVIFFCVSVFSLFVHLLFRIDFFNTR